ncbi:MFS transporter [Rhodobacteraceae bacterium W635]|uniref:c-type cytochrome n=1 Tax=Nioella halotolerans TaxID=2303578 RepID=UPI000E3CF993|nr:MFS transporter [Rhodobacteraceae bacterium W635]
MSKSLKLLLTAATLTALGAAASAQTYGLGREALPEEVAAWDIDIRPDGLGLPEGAGSVLEGEEVYLEVCASCHGGFAEGTGRWPPLAGGFGSLDGEDPFKTIGSYWPYLSTVWDYVHRAMPFGDAQSLSDDEVYAITAFLLYMNDIVLDDEFVLSNENFTEVRLPNEDGFYMDDREESPLWGAREVCMTDCAESVEITMRANILDVTPEDAALREEREAAASDEVVEEAAAEEPAEDPNAIDMELAEAGERLFRQCSSCHQVGDSAQNRTGPVLNGIVGHPAGQVEDFRYSRPMETAGDEGLVWTEDELHAYLEDPRGYLRGTRMAFRGISDEGERAAIIEYLRTQE